MFRFFETFFEGFLEDFEIFVSENFEKFCEIFFVNFFWYSVKKILGDLFENSLRFFLKEFFEIFLWVFWKIFLRKYSRDFLGFFERFWKYFFEKFFCVFFEKFDFLRDLLRDFLEIFLRDFTVYYSQFHLSHSQASIYPASRLQYSWFHYLGTDGRTEGH